ncbi:MULTISPECIES: hypothetical protein [unclassified Microcoleus]|uniref:hypothetical protein n=1 Tax=unclassified Microcoleus TaxID=2642155 RepID=UPI002FD200F6
MKSLSPSQLFHKYQADVWLVLSLIFFTGCTSFAAAQLVNPLVFNVTDIWFDSDINKSFFRMSDSNYNHATISAHPLYALFSCLPILAILTIFHLEPITGIRAFISVVSGLFIGTIFILFRLLGYQKIDAAIFSILASITAAARFWFVVPESFLFGGETILLVYCLVTVADYRQLSPYWYMAANVLTVGITITNLMAGIIATISGNRWKQCLKIFAGAFVLFILLATIQKIFFPTAALRAIFTRGAAEQTDYLYWPSNISMVFKRYSVFLFHSIVMPSIEIINSNWVGSSGGQVLSIQTSGIGSGGGWGKVATVTWGGLLALGLYALFSVKQHPRLRLTLGLTLLGQLLLHTIHGFEIFLYSLHYAPSLVILVSLGVLTKLRPVVLGLALILIVTAGINNAVQFSNAVDILQRAHIVGPEKVLLR